MSYARQPCPAVINAARGTLVRLVTHEEVVRVEREQTDPFGIALHCTNPTGHQPIASCGEIVCAHCARIF